MKRFMQLALGVTAVILLGLSPLSLWAQQAEGRTTQKRFEIGFHGGAGFIDRMGFKGVCRAVVEDGCVSDDGEFEAETTDIFMAGAGRGLTADSGLQFGLRFGFDLNSRWQLEFTWDHVLADLAFWDDALRVASIADQLDDDDRIFDAGDPRGHLNIYQLNLNYHTRDTGKVIPYFGGGFGIVQFRQPPTFFITDFVSVSTSGTELRDAGVVSLAEDTAPAFNLGGGVKIFPGKSERWGIRLDVRQLFSFYKATHFVRTFDELNPELFPFGDLEEVSADFDQESTFTHLMFTAGIFFRF
ncbi:MAG: hypothetical protein ACE5MH_01240 [Terriglobia bacterium]